MSLVTWFKVVVAEAEPAGGGLLAAAASLVGLGLPVTVSNDVLSASTILDAQISVTMSEGPTADAFEVVLVNLPTRTTTLINDTLATKPIEVTISLGYFDEPGTKRSPVLVGRLETITSSVGDDGLTRTVLRGQEVGGYLLRNKPATASHPGTADALAVARDLVERAGLKLASGSTLAADLANFTVRTDSTMDALSRLADMAGAPMVVRDRTVLLGKAVGAADDRAPIDFHPDRNLVQLQRSTAEDTANRPAVLAPDATAPNQPPVQAALTVIVLGHPGLRAGQVATVTGVPDVPTGPLRMARVTHRFNDQGYVAELAVIVADAGARAQVSTGVQHVVDRMRDAVDRSHAEHPAIDIGEVTEYTAGTDKHLASLLYGQSPDPAVAAPSVAAPVDTGEDRTLHDKPIAAPFAFHKCGLMTPVYPKMRAVLGHNRGLVNDAIVTGFLWPAEPAQLRPANRAGDYWLALPTGLGADGLPQGKGANDLIDATGQRVIQAASLHLLVGASALPEVGQRPDPLTDGSILIEHASGSSIVVDRDGAVTITTTGKAITLTNGSVSLKLDGATVSVS